MAKVQLEFADHVFVDYLSLLHLHGRWWIVNKVFNKETRNASSR